MKTAFVTGGTGFIGSHLVEELLRRGYGEVRCLVRRDRKWLDGLAVTEVPGDLFSDVRESVADVDYVFHLAGLTRGKDWESFERSNVTSTIRLVDAIREVNPGLRKVVVLSSLAAVGRSENGVVTEEAALNPVSSYGRSKAHMENALGAYHASIPLVVVRPPAVYGPRERDIYTFFKMVRAGLCPIVGDPYVPALSLIHVRDLVRGIVDAAETDVTTGETYFIGSESAYTWNDVKRAATKALGRRALTVRIPAALVGPVGATVEVLGRLVGVYPPLNRDKAREIRYVCKICSVEKAKRDFGYCASVSLEEGVAETIGWYRQEGWL